jgi:ubiquinone/menaquinone biosynthesis C-methylase UbiE
MNTEDKILKDIENGYDMMADKFSGTRKHFWRGFEFISENIKNGDRVLDFGCGNGRLLEILKEKNIEYFGVDVSQKLIDIAKEKYQKEGISLQKITSSPTLPFPDNFFNCAVSISVFHHFPKKYAKAMTREIYRVTKPDGVAIISVWNLWQKKYLKCILNPAIILRKIFPIGKYGQLAMKDVFIPFKDNQGEIFDRYHHIFSKKELVKIFEQAGFKRKKSFLLNGKNLVFIGKK